MKSLLFRSAPLAFYLSAALIFSSCQTNLKQVDLQKLATVIEMAKGPCYGRCPVFTLKIYENGTATYNGEKYTDKAGLHIKQLDKEQFKNLQGQFRQANLWQYDNVYRGQIPDLQTVTITYYEEGDYKTITGKDGRPEAVRRLEEELDAVANGGGWQLKEKPDYNLPAGAIAEELIVQLNHGIEVYRWVRKFREHDLKVVEEIGRDRNYWLLSYDTNSIAPPMMLAKVRADADVVGVEFNKTGSNRN